MTTITTMIDHHAELHRELDRLYAVGGDAVAEGCPTYKAIAREAMTLEPRIVATRATSEAEADAKQAFIQTLDDIDLGRLLAAILDLDAGAVAASR